MRKSKLLQSIRRARVKGEIPYKFTPLELREHCPGFATSTYYSYLSRHTGNTEYREHFVRHSRGIYSLKDDPIVNERSLVEFEI